MMMMKNPLILFLTCGLVLSALTVIADKTYGPKKYCFESVPGKLPMKGKVSKTKYTNSRCLKKAVIITMENGIKYCANPEEQSVNDITKRQASKLIVG